MRHILIVSLIVLGAALTPALAAPATIGDVERLRHRQPSRQRRRCQLPGEIHESWRGLLRGLIAVRH